MKLEIEVNVAADVVDKVDFQEHLRKEAILAPLVDELKLQFKPASQLDPEEKKVIFSVIESIIPRSTVKGAVRHFSIADSGGSR
jgi:hypothetical protein